MSAEQWIIAIEGFALLLALWFLAIVHTELLVERDLRRKWQARAEKLEVELIQSQLSLTERAG